MFLKGNYSASQALARGQAFMKKLCISDIKQFGAMQFRSKWMPSEVLFLVGIPAEKNNLPSLMPMHGDLRRLGTV